MKNARHGLEQIKAGNHVSNTTVQATFGRNPNCYLKSRRVLQSTILGRRDMTTQATFGSKRIQSISPSTGSGRGRQSPANSRALQPSRATRTEIQRCGTPLIPGRVQPVARAQIVTAPSLAAALTPASFAPRRLRRWHCANPHSSYHMSKSLHYIKKLTRR